VKLCFFAKQGINMEIKGARDQLEQLLHIMWVRSLVDVLAPAVMSL
jgi:hypothetical protein